MSLIAGVGDEVTQFFLALVLVLIVVLAWRSTYITDQNFIQTVWLLERRRLWFTRHLSNHTQSATITEGTSTNSENEQQSIEEDSPNTETEESIPSPSTSAEAENKEEEVSEQSRIVEAMDAEGCRQKRVAYYGKNEQSSSANNEGESHSENVQNEENQIKIKLKYLNDDLRVVKVNLGEKIGDFKKRCFVNELSSNKIVRLIFNGGVLNEDTKSLEDYGFFDDCVVHCLIHQSRNNSPAGENTMRSNASTPSPTPPPNNNANNNNNISRDYDFGNILLVLVTFTLSSAWYFRIMYSHLYTVSSTFGLILTTVIYFFLTLGSFYPNQHQIPVA